MVAKKKKKNKPKGAGAEGLVNEEVSERLLHARASRDCSREAQAVGTESIKLDVENIAASS